MSELHLLDAAETARRTSAGEVSAVEVARASLERIAALDPGLNAMSRVLATEALAEAESRDAALAAMDLIPLLGQRHLGPFGWSPALRCRTFGPGDIVFCKHYQ